MKHCEKTVGRDLCKGHHLRKMREGCDPFDTVATKSQTDVKPFHARRDQRAICPSPVQAFLKKNSSPHCTCTSFASSKTYPLLSKVKVGLSQDLNTTAGRAALQPGGGRVPALQRGQRTTTSTNLL